MRNDQIRLQQEKIWELQGREESLKTEFEELKGMYQVCLTLQDLTFTILLSPVELKVKKRLLNSKSRLAEQLEVSVSLSCFRRSLRSDSDACLYYLL